MAAVGAAEAGGTRGLEYTGPETRVRAQIRRKAFHRGIPAASGENGGHLCCLGSCERNQKGKKNAFVLCKYLLKAIISAVKNTEGARTSCPQFCCRCL